MAGLVKLCEVSFAAQNRKLVQDISFEYEEGKITALVGPSGGGKSTVLKLAAGLLIPESGEVLFKGRDIALMDRDTNLEFRREGAMVFQDSALWANQSLFQNLELPLRIHYPKMSKKEREERVDAVLAAVGYKKDLGIRPAQLSMGEQKLLAFARATICRPKLLYLDEWIESVDELAARRLINLVKKHRSEGKTTILVSHDMRVIHDLADVVVMILGGRLFLKFTREQIVADDDLRRYVEREMST
jgi:ABC-type multidrug transport system ATPase subunit